MIQFGDIFKQIMGEQGYTISSFSKLTGLDRGWLYAIFSGRRKISEQTLQTILNGHFFTQEDSQQLRRAFYEEDYGGDELDRILYLQHHFQQFRRPDNPPIPSRPAMAESLPSSGFLNSQAQLLRAAFELISQVQQSGQEAKEVYTNLPYHFTQLEELLFYTLQDHQPPYTLTRVLALLQNGSNTSNLQSVFASLRYLDRRVRLYCYYTAQHGSQPIGQIFPYYLITPTAVLLVHQDGQQGMLIRQADYCARMREGFLAALNDCSEMTYSHSNALSFLSNGQELHFTDYSVQLGNTFTNFLNQDLLQRYGSPRFAGVSRTGVITSLLNFLHQPLSSTDNFMILSRQCILDFLTTGTFPNIPRDYLQPLSMEDRLGLLRRVETHLRQHSSQSLGVLKEEIFGKYGNEYSISLIRPSHSIIICGQKLPRSGQSFVGECGLKVSNAVLYHDFLNFFEYAKRNRYISDTENALSTIRELTLGCTQPNPFPRTASAAETTPPMRGKKLTAK